VLFVIPALTAVAVCNWPVIIINYVKIGQLFEAKAKPLGTDNAKILISEDIVKTAALDVVVITVLSCVHFLAVNYISNLPLWTIWCKY